MAKARRTQDVLLLEENPDHAGLVQDVVRTHCPTLTLSLVTTAETALAYLATHQVALVIAALPLSTEGLDLTLKAIRKTSPQLPILVLSGAGDEQLAAQAIKCGAKEYLVKSRETLKTLHEHIAGLLG